jgi:V-type H+-transporting ATPase subunit H
LHLAQEKACKLLTKLIASRPSKGVSIHSTPSTGSKPVASAAAASSIAGSSSSSGDPAEAAISTFVDWLCGQLRRPSNPTKAVPTAISALAVLLREKAARAIFTQVQHRLMMPPCLPGQIDAQD